MVNGIPAIAATGLYYCGHNNLFSDALDLVGESPPGEIRRNEGRDVFITCRYRSGGVERGEFTWYGPSVSPEEDNRVTITTTSLSSELTIFGLRQKDNRTYHCTYASEHTHTTLIVYGEQI